MNVYEVHGHFEDSPVEVEAENVSVNENGDIRFFNQGQFSLHTVDIYASGWWSKVRRIREGPDDKPR